MRKSIFCLLGAFLFLQLNAHLYAEGTRNKAEREYVIIGFDRALGMAVSDMPIVLEIDELIYEAERARAGLQDELEFLESGEFSFNRLYEIFGQIRRLQRQIDDANTLHGELAERTEFFLELLFQSVSDASQMGADAIFMGSIIQVIIGVIALNDLGGSIAALEAQLDDRRREFYEAGDVAVVQELIENIQASIQEIDFTVRDLRLQQEQARLGREHALRLGIVSEREIGISKAVLGARIALAEAELGRSLHIYEYGRLSPDEISALRRNLAQMQFDYRALGRSHENAIRAINFLTGQELCQPTKVDISFGFPEVPGDVSAHVKNAIDNAPHVRRMGISVEQARRAQYNGDDQENRDSLRRAYERAAIAYTDTRNAAEIGLLRQLSELENKGENAHLLALDLTQAENRLQRVRLYYASGRATKYALNDAYFDVFVIQMNMDSLEYQLWLVEFLSGNPLPDVGL